MIPRTMSTQHPDNVLTPFFAESPVIRGDDEIKEAFYAFSHLGCHEQMWDHEGKEVDNFVVRKLLSRYGHFFRDVILGRDVRLTLRVPNPSWEKAEAKVLLETLESIPRSFDVAKIFYGEDIAPIYEVIFPMTTSHIELNRVYYYYKNFVVGKQNKSFFYGDITIAEWIGEFKPHEINVIPLIEDLPYILSCDEIVRKYLSDKFVEYQRVFLAKSDLAMNYGAIASTFALKIALVKLRDLEEELSTPIYPIVGFGSAPFRGNLRPDTVDYILRNWRGVQTFTIQSAFKYDFPERDVVNAIDKINSSDRGKAEFYEFERALEIINKTSEEYRACVRALIPIINEVAKYTPKRRERKLHIGLFGYSRELNGKTLPRAIPFCCALYSIGLPPDILGLSCLDGKELEFVLEFCERDLKDALRFFNPNVLKILPEIVSDKVKRTIENLDFEIDELYREASDEVLESLNSLNEEMIMRCAYLRRFLG